MPRTQKALVNSQLENISQSVLIDHRDSVRALIKGKFGIYALYRGEKLYYVGLASNLMSRLRQHLNDKHKRKWNRFSVYLVNEQKHVKDLETLFLRILRPDGNSVKGKFKGAANLRKDLNRNLKEQDEKRRAELLGGHVARRLRNKVAKSGRGQVVVSGLVRRKTKVKAWYKQYEYTAYILRDGTIDYGGKIFSSPSSAAQHITKRATNGWRFWYYSKNREWHPISQFRK